MAEFLAQKENSKVPINVEKIKNPKVNKSNTK